jgi:hypothetical protein
MRNITKWYNVSAHCFTFFVKVQNVEWHHVEIQNVEWHNVEIQTAGRRQNVDIPNFLTLPYITLTWTIAPISSVAVGDDTTR